MTRPPRVLEIFAGLSLLGWALFSLEGDLTPQRSLVVAVQLTVAVLLLLDRPLRQSGTLGQALRSLPAFLVGGCALGLAEDWTKWPAGLQWLFVLGGLLTIVSLGSLGRSFGILPASRQTVVSGPYRLVRHPAYAGQLAMIAACCLASPFAWAAWIPLIAIPLLAMRIFAEEAVLGQWSDYRSYRQRVRWRLLPLVW